MTAKKKVVAKQKVPTKKKTPSKIKAQEQIKTRNPSWLDSPPESDFPSPPISPRAQSLPYGELSWENFEKLILRVVRRETTISECWSYGERGQNQFGLDILAECGTFTGAFFCFQCKRVKAFPASKIKTAVTTFLKGDWASRTKRFVLCTTLPLSKTGQVNEIAKQREILKTKGIEFEVWDGSEGGQLSERLKKHPDLVDDFFLRDWVLRFNGPDAVKTLGEKLDGEDLAKLRIQLREIYTTLFHRNDQGIRLDGGRTVPLLERYVVPSVVETRMIPAAEGADEKNTENLDNQPKGEEQSKQRPSDRSARGTAIQEMQISIGEWLSRNKKTVILGEPGYGKSSLLRVITLQLLNGLGGPISLPWNDQLPVWVSFGGFCAAIQRQDDLSLEDYFDQWLHKHSADPVRTLFQRALRQRGVLLLIDGLDECQNSYVAQQAMSRISSFLSIQQIPVIFTSRPRGYSQVKPDGAWPSVRLAPFDEAQIECFANIWINHIETPTVASGQPPAWRIQDTVKRTAEFMKAIRANPHIFDLARTPLFCQLLLDVYRFSHHLPEQRTKVYDKVIELLLSDHPAARAQAAGVPSALDTLKRDDVFEMLMRLALHIQGNSGAGVISPENCKAVFCSFLEDDLNGPGYSRYEAQAQAQSVIDYAQTGLGLIVERAPNELGFFHLTVQEYLAARAMAREDEDKQFAWLVDVWNKSRWHEVVLSWFGIIAADRNREVSQRAIDHLKAVALGTFEKLTLLRLRTELAVSDLCLSPREARKIIEEASDEVEVSPFPELRRELARHITLGLRFPSISKECEARIASWLPARSEWDRARLLEHFEIWDQSDDLLDALKIALHDDSMKCRLAAAKCLSKVYTQNTNAGEYLVQLAANWPDVEIQAVALHALARGWAGHDSLASLADAACASMDADLALVGISIRVTEGRHNKTDLEHLWTIFYQDNVSYELKGFCRSVMVQGWGNDAGVKCRAIDAISGNGLRGGFQKIRFAGFLIESWPGDAEVGRCIANWIEDDSMGMHLHDEGITDKLSQSFRGNPDISRSLRAVLAESKKKYPSIFWGPDSEWAYCAIGDDVAKKELLDGYASESDYVARSWIVSTLMKAWPDDADIREFLAQEFLHPPEQVAYLSPWIEQFVLDAGERREWLLKALEVSDHHRVGQAAHRILEEFDDDECRDAVLAVLEKDIWVYSKISIQNLLIRKFPQLPEVEQWKQSAFSEIDDTSLYSVAAGFSTDADSRARLLRAARPAREDVRAEVYRVFREYSIPPHSVLRLTDEIWAEDSGMVRTAGVVARCSVASLVPEKYEELIKKLLEELTSLGSAYEKRRHAAFAGLLQLKEYDRCIDAISEKSSGSLRWLSDYHSTDTLAVRMVFECWGEFHAVAQSKSITLEIPWDALLFYGGAREALVNENTRKELLEALLETKRQSHTTASLALMAELIPKSEALRSALITKISHWSADNDSLGAERLFAEQFGGDEQALLELQKAQHTFGPEENPSECCKPYFYALVRGWPDSKLIPPFINGDVPLKGLSFVAVLALCEICGNEEWALECIDEFIRQIAKGGSIGASMNSQSLRDWANAPHAESLLRNLMKDSDLSRKITAIRLLASIGKLTPADCISLTQQFDAMRKEDEVHYHDGIDLLSGSVTTLPQAIFRVLSSE